MKKAFDSVSWMRRRRAQIDEEDATLTWAQRRRKTHEQVLQDPVPARLCEETALPGKGAPTTVKTK